MFDVAFRLVGCAGPESVQPEYAFFGGGWVVVSEVPYPGGGFSVDECECVEGFEPEGCGWLEACESCFFVGGFFGVGELVQQGRCLGGVDQVPWVSWS